MKKFKIRRVINELKWAYQRVKKGYSDNDLGDIDIWFLETIPNMLEDFKKKNNAIPQCIIEEYYDLHKDELKINFEEFNNDYNTSEDKEKEVLNEWNKRLDKIIYCFRSVTKNGTYPYIDSEQENLKEGFELFIKYFNNLWF